MKPMSFEFASRRSMILAHRGMVASENPLSAQAGLAILRAGGQCSRCGDRCCSGDECDRTCLYGHRWGLFCPLL